MEERKGIVYNSQITNFTYSSKEERDYFEKKYMADQLKKQAKLQEEYNELLKKQIESSENQQREMENKQRAIEDYEIEKSWNEYKEDLKHEAFDKLTVEQLKSTINRKKKKLQELKEQNLGDPLYKNIEKTTIESTLQPSVILIFIVPIIALVLHNIPLLIGSIVLAIILYMVKKTIITNKVKKIDEEIKLSSHQIQIQEDLKYLNKLYRLKTKVDKSKTESENITIKFTEPKVEVDLFKQC